MKTIPFDMADVKSQFHKYDQIIHDMQEQIIKLEKRVNELQKLPDDFELC